MNYNQKELLREISKNKQELSNLKKYYSKTEKHSRKLVVQVEGFGRGVGARSAHFEEFSKLLGNRMQWEQELLKRIEHADRHIIFLEKGLSKK